MGYGGGGKGGWGYYGWGYKGGWGKGWGKGGGKGGAKPKTAPEDFSITPEQRFTGTCLNYYKFQGYGFLKLDQADLVPDDKVFAHWTSLKSSDRFPSINKDMQLSFSIEKVEKNGTFTLQATNVTLPDGSAIGLQDSDDQDKKTFVGGQNLRYTGTMKFYIPSRGYGYIAIDDGFQYGEGETVPKEIRSERAEMDAGGKNAGYMKDVAVEFGIWKTRKGAYKAYNVTLPGGVQLPVDVPKEPTEAEATA